MSYLLRVTMQYLQKVLMWTRSSMMAYGLSAKQVTCPMYGMVGMGGVVVRIDSLTVRTLFWTPL